jgi:hypothetical protein
MIPSCLRKRLLDVLETCMIAICNVANVVGVIRQDQGMWRFEGDFRRTENMPDLTVSLNKFPG